MPASAPAPTVSPQELARLFEEFSEATRRMQESHAVLQDRVVKLRGELAEKNRLLERKKRLEALGLMVAGVAHEIRNPLGSIALYLDCLTQEVQGELSKPDCLRLIGQIDDAVSHLNSVVDSMLVFTADSRRREPCDLEDLFEEAVHLVRSDLERAGTALGDLDREGSRKAVVPGNREHVRCVFANVLKNAVEAMGDGGRIQVRIEGTVEEEKPSWLVSIRDTGPGIPEADLENVLVPFFSDDSKKGGVGLGLAIVHSLMERQGGRVELRNTAAGGLEVRLVFAMTPDPDEEADDGEEDRAP